MPQICSQSSFSYTKMLQHMAVSRKEWTQRDPPQSSAPFAHSHAEKDFNQPVGLPAKTVLERHELSSESLLFHPSWGSASFPPSPLQRNILKCVCRIPTGERQTLPSALLSTDYSPQVSLTRVSSWVEEEVAAQNPKQLSPLLQRCRVVTRDVGGQSRAREEPTLRSCVQERRDFCNVRISIFVDNDAGLEELV